MEHKGLLGKKSSLFDSLLILVPLTYWGITKRMVGADFKTILDIGCGTGVPMEILNRDNKFLATGVDVYNPYLEQCKEKKIYKKLVKKDVRTLNFHDKSFDTVICFHVIEHLTRKEGKTLMKKIEKIAKKRIVIAVPIGHLHQEAYDGNEHQAHKSEWFPEDFKKEGYTVVGQGLKAFYKEENIVNKFGVFSYLIFFVGIIFQPLLFIKPELAVYMICRKDL